MTAFLLKATVLALLLGMDSLAKTSPTMKAWMRQPITLCVDISTIASTHSVVVWRLP
jgi:hypothetical protein